MWCSNQPADTGIEMALASASFIFLIVVLQHVAIYEQFLRETFKISFHMYIGKESKN